MPYRKRARGYKRKPRKMRVGRTLRAANPAPVFTEMYELTRSPAPGFQVFPNTGNVFRFSMDHIPQLAQYTSLYQKYRILKASLLILPEYTGSEQNRAEANSALTQSNFGQSRMALAVNNSPSVAPPANELDVLKDNGAKVKSLTPSGIRVSCRPVPNVSIDSNQPGVGNQSITLRKKYLNLNAQNGNIDHYGISWWHTQKINGAAPAVQNVAIVYVKLTFQLSDPR
ncbi:MAG: capsid protein [Cressdnaviricota sp.]|nr:MAG: capsid protein [Cressdnaviricota sp.]